MSLQSKGLVVHIPFADFRVPKEGLEGIGGDNGITFVYYKKGGVVAFSRISIKIAKGLGITPETPPEKAAATLLFGPFSTGRLIKKEIGNGQVLYARSFVNMPGFRTIVVFRGKTATLIDVKLPLKCFGEMLKTFQPSR